MKAKFLFMGAAAALSLGVVGYVAMNGGSEGVDFVPQVARSEKLAPVTQDVSKGGNAVYLAFNHDTVGWDNDEAKFAIYFFNGGGDGWSDVLTYIHTDGYGNKIYSGVVPANNGSGAWTKMIAVRMPKEKTSGTFDDKYNQTNDITIDSAKNQIKITGWDTTNFETYTTSAAERIAFWADEASQWTSTGVCDAGGATVQKTLEDSWAATAVTYAAIKGADVKAYFSNVDANEDATAKRYDFIRAAHPTWTLSNFASR